MSVNISFSHSHFGYYLHCLYVSSPLNNLSINQLWIFLLFYPHPLLPLMYYPLSRTVYLHDVDQNKFLFHVLTRFIIFAFSFLTPSTNRPIRIFYLYINYLFPSLLPPSLQWNYLLSYIHCYYPFSHTSYLHVVDQKKFSFYFLTLFIIVVFLFPTFSIFVLFASFIFQQFLYSTLLSFS